MFELVGKGPTSGGGTPNQRFVGGEFDLGGKDAGVVRIRGSVSFFIQINRAVDFSGDGIDIVGRVYEGAINNTSLRPNNTTARGLVMRENSNGDQPGDIQLGPAFEVSGPNETCVSVQDGASVAIGGHYEGSHGRANIDVRDDGSVQVTPYTSVANNDNSASGIYFDGNRGYIAPSEIIGSSSHAIEIGSGAVTCAVPSGVQFSSISGDLINYTDEVNQLAVVPYKGTLRDTSSGGNPVTYPSGPWFNTCYPDGWRLLREGTTTVQSGETVQAENFSGDAGDNLRWDLNVDSDPGVEPVVLPGLGWDTGSSKQAFYLHEIATPGSPVDIDWTLYRR
jgi:hypothetical protein